MASDDPFAPFGDDDRTVIRPSPGGRRAPAAVPESAPVTHGQPMRRELDPQLWELAKSEDNPLLSASSSLISLAMRLRNTASYAAITELQQSLVAEIRNFENRSLQAGVSQEDVRMASYAVCSFLDETILNTPWGAQSIWGHQSLLILFHKEAWGGERFFEILSQLLRFPAQNLPLIELGYVLISLGFEGKYRIIANGVNALEKLRLELFQLIHRVRGDAEPELSPRWRGQTTEGNALVRQLPLWVIACILGAILLAAYIGFAIAINGASDPVFRQFFALSKEEINLAPSRSTMPVIVKPVTPAKGERFKPLLAAEIRNHMVEVVDDRILRIRNSFASGSDQVKSSFIPLLNKIAHELEAGQDSILVTGHTDDVPIVSAKFPSNWHLSTARAKHVLDLLESAAHLAGNPRFEGRGDGEPLEPNDSAEHRALNRRVDILIK